MKISSFNRERKYKLFLELMKPESQTSILDVGYTEEEYRPSDNLLEKSYAYPEKITALGIDQPTKFSARYLKVKAVVYDGKKFPFTNKQFDLCWSNAVLEHVGGEADQVLFLQEIKRVSKRAFISTPNKCFPIELHTKIPLLHWLPKPMFDRILKLIGKSWAAGEYMNLLNLKQVQDLLENAGITDYQIIKNKFLFWTIDFVIVF
ncbi:MAG: class I SAM-dependent methyltransferase [Candidatus Parcubacteria bacterium]|nr:class I SAM-dependent methyltransferase [Candidatus Parcubacteria bacterium]